MGILISYTRVTRILLTYFGSLISDLYCIGVLGRGGGGGELGSVLLGMCHWPLRAPAPL